MDRLSVLKRLTVFLLIIVGVTQSRLHLVRAIEPTKDYWFTEILTVSDVKLPAGLEIITSNPSSQPRGSLILKNQTQTLLYVMSLRYKDVLVMATPDAGWKARVIGAQEAASYLVAPSRPAHLSMEALMDLDQNLVDRNMLTFDPPPIDVSIPAAQSSELLLVYGEQVIEVPLRLAYTLNTNFNYGTGASQSQQMNVQVTGDASAAATPPVKAVIAPATRNNLVSVGLLGAAVLLITGWLVWRGLNRSK